MATTASEEVHIPAPIKNKSIKREYNELMDISNDFPDFRKLAFVPFEIKKLNSIQSQCYKPVFETNTNL